MESKGKIWAAAVVVVLIIIAGVWAFGGKSSDTQGAQAAVASGHPEWPPIMFKNGDVIDGAGPALVKKIFDSIGIPVSFPYAGTWDQVQAKARTGEVDVLVAAYKTDERQTYMDYSDPYTVDPIVLFVAKGKAFPFETWDALKAKKGVAMIGDSYGQEFDDFSSTSLKLARVATTDEALAMVLKGDADYFIYSLYAGNVQLNNTNQADKFEHIEKPVANENFYITISKKSPLVSYMPQINEAIAKYKADGTIEALVAQYNQAQ
jgi:polar amino acid transport system substrate-binding protein